MSFFDQVIDPADYQTRQTGQAGSGLPMQQMQQPMQQKPAQSMPNPMTPQAGLPGMPKQNFAAGGLAQANKVIEQTQIMKVFENYFKNLGVDVAKGMQALKKEIAQGLQLIPYESSVMGYKQLDKTTAQIHFFTVGTMQDLAKDMAYFYKYLKDKGVKTIYDTMPAPITIEMLEKYGAMIEESDNPKYKLKATL